MATSSWTPNSTIHINDGTLEYDLPFINNDSFGSVYRLYGINTTAYSQQMSIRHGEDPATALRKKTLRHNMTFAFSQAGASGALKDDASISVSMKHNFDIDPTFAVELLNTLPALLSVSAVRTQLLGWRI